MLACAAEATCSWTRPQSHPLQIPACGVVRTDLQLLLSKSVHVPESELLAHERLLCNDLQAAQYCKPDKLFQIGLQWLSDHYFNVTNRAFQPGTSM